MHYDKYQMKSFDSTDDRLTSRPHYCTTAQPVTQHSSTAQKKELARGTSVQPCIGGATRPSIFHPSKGTTRAVLQNTLAGYAILSFRLLDRDRGLTPVEISPSFSPGYSCWVDISIFAAEFLVAPAERNPTGKTRTIMQALKPISRFKRCRCCD